MFVKIQTKHWYQRLIIAFLVIFKGEYLANMEISEEMIIKARHENSTKERYYVANTPAILLDGSVK